MVRRPLPYLLAALFLSIPPMARAGTVSLPQTGQAASYAAGDDGALRIGTAWPDRRFVDNGDQTVTDTLTGLMWEKSAYSGSGDVNPFGGISGTSTWQRALDGAAYYNSTNHLGYSDWRLPNVSELKSILNVEHANQADWLMSQGFATVLPRTYWTSTTEMSTRVGAYSVDLSNGMITLTGKSQSQSYVWYVRSGSPGATSLAKTGQKNCWGTDGAFRTCSGSEDGALQSGTAWPTPRFTDNSKTTPSDLTMTDNLTGVIWTRSGALAGQKTWQQALDFVQGLNGSNYLGHSDWRLPNRAELESLAQLNYVNTAFQLTQQGFTAVLATQYWSSSTSANDPTKAWAVDLNRSVTFDFAKTSSFQVWPVRTGTGAPALSVSPAGRDFGTVTTNTAASQTFTVTNSGTAALPLGGIILTGSDSTSFILTVGDGSGGTCGAAKTLPPGGSCTISATFAPVASGARSAVLRVSSVDARVATRDLPLTGTAVDPSYVISTSVIGGGGSIACDSPVLSGKNSACSIAPGQGYRLATLTDNGADRFPSVSGGRYSIYDVTADHAVSATFGPNTPVLFWGAPADIVYSTPLSAAQLNATADVAGTFLYTPGAGTVLHAGVQTLGVTFTPSDPTYVAAKMTVPLTVAKADQTITFPPMDKKSFKDGAFDPGATASSGLPVSYQSSDTSVAVPSGRDLAIIGGGTAQITAYQLGNADYNPAPPQAQLLKVTGRRSQEPGFTIDALPDGSTTGDPVFTIVATVSRLYLDGKVVVRITGNGTTFSYEPAVALPSGAFSLTLLLGAGANVVEITATSKFGVSVDRRTIYLEAASQP